MSIVDSFADIIPSHRDIKVLLKAFESFECHQKHRNFVFKSTQKNQKHNIYKSIEGIEV